MERQAEHIQGMPAAQRALHAVALLSSEGRLTKAEWD